VRVLDIDYKIYNIDEQITINIELRVFYTKVNHMSRTKSNSTNSPAPLFHRLAAMVYDSFILFSFLLLATTLALIANKGQSLLPYRIYFLSYLFIVTGLFLAWFWQKGGQTLGMLAWKIKLVDEQNQRISWRRAFLRYVLCLPSLGLFGIGLLWCLFDKNKQSLHDLIAKTKVVKR
jgi:uncharacterized RDD family membrane protein YckC